MDRSLLETFVTAAETLNFSETAVRRGVVQSAVSAQIAKLESDVGVTLLDRARGRAMTLTPEGAVFVVQARRILDLMEDAVDTLRRPEAPRRLHFGLPSTLAAGLMPPVLAQFAAAWPQVEIEMSCDRSPQTLRAFDRGERDVALITDQGRRSDRVSVTPVPLAWVAADLFEAGPENPLPLAFLSDGRDLRRYALSALDRAGRNGRVAYQAGDPMALRAFVAAGLAVTVMPRIAVVPPLRVLDGLPELGTLPLAIYQATQAHRRDVDAFVDLLQASLAQGG